MQWIWGLLGAYGAVALYLSNKGAATGHAASEAGSDLCSDSLPCDDEDSSATSWLLDDDGSSEPFLSEPGINPASGLPMVGAVDIDGNPYGTDLHAGLLDPAHGYPLINPANGLPMMGAIDIEGNPYGTDLHAEFDHTHMDCYPDTHVSDSAWEHTSSRFDDSFSASSDSWFD